MSSSITRTFEVGAAVWIAFLAASPRGFARQVMITSAPSRAKCVAAARPRPDVAPVTRTVWSLKVPGGGRGSGTKRPLMRWNGRSRSTIVLSVGP